MTQTMRLSSVSLSVNKHGIINNSVLFLHFDGKCEAICFPNEELHFIRQQHDEAINSIINDYDFEPDPKLLEMSL